MEDSVRYSRLVKAEARKQGFVACGIARAEYLEEEADRFKDYLDRGYQGKMSYLEKHFEKRLDPTKLVEGARSLIVVAYNYYTARQQTDPQAPVLSKYAYGKDYHFVLKEKLQELVTAIQKFTGPFAYRIFVDSAPVLERAWARRAGLGWIGKNANLINPNHGSFFFLAEIISDLDLEADQPVKDRCGSCTRCIDACPTGAIVRDRVIDGSRCISYLTIELRDKQIPDEFKNKLKNRVFGCDICQDVCPWNRFSSPHSEEKFNPHPDLLNLNRTDWLNMDKLRFNSLFEHSAVQRARFKGLKRNLLFLADDQERNYPEHIAEHTNKS